MTYKSTVTSITTINHGVIELTVEVTTEKYFNEIQENNGRLGTTVVKLEEAEKELENLHLGNIKINQNMEGE